MKVKVILIVLLSMVSVLSSMHFSPGYTQQSTETSSSVVSRIFVRPLPVDFQVAQAGKLTKQEGIGFFVLLSSSINNTRAVIVQLDQLSWLKTKEIESARAAKVGQQLVTEFSPELLPLVITEEPPARDSSQYASHLRMTNAQGVSKPAIALRLLYPKNKADILLLWQQQNSPNFPLAYQQLETQAKLIVSELKEPATSESHVTERYILWRLRHIFKNGVFTHMVEPNK